MPSRSLIAPKGRTAGARSRRRLGWLPLFALALVVWLAAGYRPLGEGRFGVVEGPPGFAPRKVAGRWTIAPPGLIRLSTYPSTAVEIALPQAEQARIPAPDGSRFGMRGWITLRARPEAWARVHAAARGAGLAGLLLGAVREAGAELAPGGPAGSLTVAQKAGLEDRLSRALAERGVDLRRLDLDAIDFLGASLGGRPTATAGETRLLVIGIDGADWEILDALFERDALPQLERLVSGGVRAKLLSITPLLSPVVWTSVATGVEPSRHGILDFLVQDESGGARQPVTSAQRRVPTFWELLSAAGVEVGVVGWWATWPADPVRGYLVSDRIAYQLFGYRADPDDPQGKSWPPGLYEEIRPWIADPTSIGWDQIDPYLAGARKREAEFDPDERQLLDEFRTLLASGSTYLSIAKGLGERHRPRLEVVYFEGTDTVGHLFMPYRPPPLPGVEPSRIESFGQIVDRYYRTIDGYLGELLSGREGWNVIVLSDHGFASDKTRPRSTDSRVGHGAAADWHRRFGMLVLAGPAFRSGQRITEASVYDIAPTVLALFGHPVPRSWPGRVLADALTERFVDEHPVRYASEDPQRQARREAIDDPGAADLLEKLRSLGYISAGGGAAGSVNARNNAGVSLMAEGRFAEAEREFRLAIESGALAPMLRVNLGLCLRHQGRAEEAAPLLREAMEHPGTYRLAANQMALLLLEAAEPDEAERITRDLLAREPDAAEAHDTLGLILERRGLPQQARAAYLRAAELDPDDALARSNLGNLAKDSGALDEAERWYLRAIEADPYFMGAYNNLALVYQAEGKMQRAIDLYARALGKAPESSIVLNNLASLYFATGEPDRAAELWERLVGSEPDYASPWSNLAGVEITRGRLDEAERLLERALSIDADYGDARINLAIVLVRRGDRERARRELERAAADARSAAHAWTELGLLELEDGRADRATEALRRALLVAPRSTKTLNALGEAHLVAGRRDAAVETWRRSLAIDPDQPQVRHNLRVVEGESDGPPR